MKIRDYDPTKGCAFQGDVAIVPIPADIKVSTIEQIKPVGGRLILQEGEVSGHHHAIALLERPETETPAPATKPRSTRKFKAVEAVMADALAGRIAVPTARMYRDAEAVTELRRRNIITREDLAIACLVVENGPMVVSHEEHDGIRLPPGQYYIGRQVESAGAEERVVQD